MHVNFFYWGAIPFNELVIILSYPPSDSEVKTMHPLAKEASGWRHRIPSMGVGGGWKWGRGIWPLVSSKFKILGSVIELEWKT